LSRNLAELHATTDMACAILERTCDGDDLEPGDLNLTVSAVNGSLTGTGIKAFDNLYRLVMAGSYKKPWLHGVKPMTRDHEGYIFYKDKQVEHYSKPYVNSLEARRALTELRNQCAYLELVGEEVSCANVVWGWEKHREAYGQEKQAELDRMLNGGGISFSRVVIDNNWNAEICFYRPDISGWEDIRDSPEFRDLHENNDNSRGFEVSIQSYHYGGEKEISDPAAFTLIPSCFEYLTANRLLEKVKSQNYMVEPVPECEVDDKKIDDSDMSEDMDEDIYDDADDDMYDDMGDEL